MDSWEDDDIVLPSIVIPPSAEELRKKDQEERDAFIQSMQEGAQFRKEQQERAAKIAAEEKKAAEERQREEKKQTDVLVARYRVHWFKEHCQEYNSLSQYHKNRKDKEFQEYLKQKFHGKSLLGLRGTLHNISCLGSGAEAIKFIV